VNPATKAAVVLALAVLACQPPPQGASLPVGVTTGPATLAPGAPAPTTPESPEHDARPWRLLRDDAAAVDNTRVLVRQMVQIAEQFRVQTGGACPTSVEELHAKGFLPRVMLDGWDRPLQILCPGASTPLDVLSAGSDGQFYTLDDIVASRLPQDPEQ
jgi:hypothetical protein